VTDDVKLTLAAFISIVAIVAMVTGATLLSNT
jgi:hypothetical protein